MVVAGVQSLKVLQRVHYTSTLAFYPFLKKLFEISNPALGPFAFLWEPSSTLSA